ncbi:MAG: glycosyltransferase [Cyanobacteria bacterium J06598_3]
MTKVLFIATSIPFPPRQGIELPNAHIAEALSKVFELDMLVIVRSPQDERLLEARRANVPATIGEVFSLRSQGRSRHKKLWQELTLQRPTFFIEGYEKAALKERFKNSPYDAVWVSPVGGLGLLAMCQQLGLPVAPIVALGCNDVITTTYLDSLREWVSGRLGFSRQRLFQGLRSIVVWPLEKRYLQAVDLLHVQTPLEKKRAHWLLGKQAKQPIVIAAQNGRKRSLEAVVYNNQSPKTVLYMTHLKGGRAQESRWFLQKVWPKIVARHPDAKLLLAGTLPVPNGDIARSLPPEAEVLGFVEDLVKLYSSVSLAVVPIVHSTGLINRALDALTAGVPMVSTSPVLSTVAGCEPGRDALSADSVDDFAAAVCRLLENPEQRQALSTAGRALAAQQPTWLESTQAIVAAMGALQKQSEAEQHTVPTPPGQPLFKRQHFLRDNTF